MSRLRLKQFDVLDERRVWISSRGSGMRPCVKDVFAEDMIIEEDETETNIRAVCYALRMFVPESGSHTDATRAFDQQTPNQ